ncbi:putative arabinose efflux permease, MFS family [Prauserella aidingensis]|uniref:MFS transporter n=1 Tax=Prauserella aidingensis TaxID=387890 RepID=UPI0020A3A605|nr:MFS transporter [Prauserella aidingensis]MCP2251461.1 putative arabinose efflux permease, MFS family [Prauserella aidingensis]
MNDRRFLLPVVLSTTFVQLLNVTIAQVAAPAIRSGLDTGPGAVQLVLVGYTLTYACVLVTAARLGDRYGYRRLFVLGTAVFMVGSMASAAAPGAGWLIAARLVQGAGSGLVAPQVLSLIHTGVSPERRPRALALYGATMGVASLAGPLVGGLLIGADLFGLGWRAVFLVTLPVTFVSLTGARLLPHTPGTDEQRVDWVGATLATTGFGALILPCALGREAGWPWWTWASFAVAAAALSCFARTLRNRQNSLIHPSVLRDGTARRGVLLVFVFNAGVPSFTYLLFLHLQSALGYSALSAALVSAPFAAAAIPGSRAAPSFSRRLGSTALTVAALVLTGMALVLALLIDTEAGRVVALPVLAAGGAAFGLFTASVFTLVLASVRSSAASSVSGLLPTAQQLGGTIGVTAAGMAYFAPSDGAGAAFGHAMSYEAAIFLITASLALRLRRTDSGPDQSGTGPRRRGSKSAHRSSSGLRHRLPPTT